MPTPSDSTDELPSQTEDLLHTTCPPEIDRAAEWRAYSRERFERAGSDATASTSLDDETPPLHQAMRDSPQIPGSTEKATHEPADRAVPLEPDPMSPTTTSESPANCQVEDDKDSEQVKISAPTSSALDLPWSARLGIESSRLIQTHTSSMLRPGSRFIGTQQSDPQRYNVEVEIKTVDMSESSICGYLKIEGLTPEHQTLTTCFEGEIIGPKYTFQTRHEDWGATDKDDVKAWARFPAWRAVGKQAKKSADFHYKNSTNRENMFMRWKEKFLVPDHRVREITGASFEGFYYICFNQVHGTITGIYYHAKTDRENKVQQLELKWVNDRGCLAATEFR